MKISISLWAVLLINVMSSRMTQAQGTLYLSNLSQPSGGSAAVASNAWLAALFYTGSYPKGYALNSVQLLMGQPVGSPSGFDVLLYNSVMRQPGNSVARLGGADPQGSGLVNFVAPPATILSPFTSYYIVLRSTTPAAQGSYSMSVAATTAYTALEGWNGSGGRTISDDGAAWTVALFPFQFAINATAIPEPSVLALLSLGGGWLAWALRQRRH